MKRTRKKRSVKTGLPPGTLVHIGEQKIEKPSISIIKYGKSGYQETELSTFDRYHFTPTQGEVTWLSVEGIHDTRLVESLGTTFHLHHLLLEDLVNTEQLPKTEDYGQYIFVVVKTLSFDALTLSVAVEQVGIVIGDSYLISLDEGGSKICDIVKERIKEGRGLIRSFGTDYLCYALLDTIVDRYFDVLEKISEAMETLEERLIRGETSELINDIHRLRNNITLCRRYLWPTREMVNRLQHSVQSTIFRDTTTVYLRDIQDHLFQIIDTMEAYRENISSLLDIYISSVSNRLNHIMKVLTIIATIFMPLSFVAGIYGMNFKNMPELEWHYGYFISLALMLIVGIFMLIFFRKKKWF